MRGTHRLRRTAAGLLGATLLGLTTACGSSGAADTGEPLRIWALKDPQNEPVVQRGIEEFNRNSERPAKLSAFPNDWYALKLRTAIGALNAPDVFLNWGGGNLAQFVNDGKVADLTEAMRKNSAVADAFMPSVLELGKVNGRQYALPMTGIQPVMLFYNKSVFASAGLEPPQTYDELLKLVDEFKRRGITPIALPGTQSWTLLMWLEYLLDRIGGPEKFAAIAAGKDGAWADPAVVRALEMCQDLAERGAFGRNFGSINYDPSGASRLLATGKAAMFLMGSWEYTFQLTNNPDFIRGGNLGWLRFPTVAGGTGDPANVVGNPANYFSVRADAPRTEQAIEFLMTTLTSEPYLDALIGSGQVPAVKGVEAKLRDTENADFATFTYKLVEEAPAFTQSWDQALSSEVSEAMLSNLQKLFHSQITPEEYVAAMEAVS